MHLLRQRRSQPEAEKEIKQKLPTREFFLSPFRGDVGFADRGLRPARALGNPSVTASRDSSTCTVVPFFVAVSALGSYPAARGYGSVLMSKIFGGINVNRLLRSNNGSTFEPSGQTYAVVFSFV